jgi:hypothetical protein
VIVGRFDDLIADVVIGGAALARSGGGVKVTHPPYIVGHASIDNE